MIDATYSEKYDDAASSNSAGDGRRNDPIGENCFAYLGMYRYAPNTNALRNDGRVFLRYGRILVRCFAFADVLAGMGVTKFILFGRIAR